MEMESLPSLYSFERTLATEAPRLNNRYYRKGRRFLAGPGPLLPGASVDIFSLSLIKLDPDQVHQVLEGRWGNRRKNEQRFPNPPFCIFSGLQ